MTEFLKYKEINRNIKFEGRQKNSPYRCKYRDKKRKEEPFDLLRVNISCESEFRSYEVEYKYLLEDRDSISFKAIKQGDSFEISWMPSNVAKYIKRIR